MKDEVAIFEAAYSLEGEERAWLARLSEVLRLNVECCAGIGTQTYDATQNGWITVRASEHCGIDSKIVSMIESSVALPASALTSRERRAFVQIFRTRFVGSLRTAPATLRRAGVDEDRVGAFEQAVGHFFEQWNQLDQWWVNAQDPTGIGCLLVILTTHAWQPHARQIHRWHCMAAHIAAAFRIRRQFAELGRKPVVVDGAPAEAIFGPDGTLFHVERPAQSVEARAQLRSAAIALDRARGPLRRADPSKAVETWHALVAGRWSLLDQFDSDGRRFVVAYRNDAKVPDARGLTHRESQVLAHLALGHSNKAIAYELGLSVSTVSAHLASLRSKLRVSSTAALLRDFAERRRSVVTPQRSSPDDGPKTKVEQRS